MPNFFNDYLPAKLTTDVEPYEDHGIGGAAWLWRPRFIQYWRCLGCCRPQNKPDDELAPNYRTKLDELEDPGEAPRASQQSSGTQHADMAASRDSADSASVSGQHRPARAGVVVQSARQDLHDPTAPLHSASPDSAVTVEGDNEPAHVSPSPRATRAGSLGGNASELDAGSAKVPTAIPEVVTIAVFDLTGKDPEGNTPSPCE